LRIATPPRKFSPFLLRETAKSFQNAAYEGKISHNIPKSNPKNKNIFFLWESQEIRSDQRADLLQRSISAGYKPAIVSLLLLFWCRYHSENVGKSP
jgi:hypothetical protein